MKLRSLIAGLSLLAGQAFGADLRLYVFDCGSIDVTDIALFSPGVDVGKSKQLVGSCYLISHPKGSMIWDTGFNDAIAAMPDGLKPNGAFHIHLKKTLAAQLKEVGVDPKSVTYMGLSHMHFDHIGNTAMFPSATLLMQKEEYESAFGPDAAKFGNDEKTYPSLRANPVKQLTGDYDVFGDGSVTIKRVLGHTPGHQALYLQMPKSGNILLSGDLVHFQENWERRGVPSFNFDKETSVKSMNEVAQFLKDNKATLWIQHDPAQNAATRHAPAFYE